MNKQFTWKLVTVIALVVLSVWSLLTNGIKLGLDLKGGTSFVMQMTLTNIDITARGDAQLQAIETIRKRIDKFNVSEPIVQAVGDGRILVQLPGLEEKDRLAAKETLSKTAFLEFRLVHADSEQLLAEERNDPAFTPPAGYVKLIRKPRPGEPRQTEEIVYVKTRPERGLTGKYVKRAYPQMDPTPYVSMEFTDEGAKIFEQVTTANVHRRLAIVLDGELYSAPVIQSAIVGGRAQITGTFTLPEATQLANVLENPLQAPVKIVEERAVDPSLGKDSIHSGVTAAAIGAVAVVLFMVIYYMAAGVVADLALVLNILLLMGALAAFKFTLTLPGIAGIVLTIGMAVDANVLIYERIREELAAAKPLRAAITAGYTRAFLVIFDSNFTTIITAVILILLGTGPVKGWGWTLTFGLLANLFAAVFVTRMTFDWAVGKGILKSFKMLHVFAHVPHINFLGVWKIAFGLSWLLIAAGTWSFVQRGGLKIGEGEVYGIDFKGGDSVTMTFAEKVDPTQIRQSIEKLGIGEAFIQYQHELTGAKEVLSLKLPAGREKVVVDNLQKDFAAAKFTVESTDHVEGIVGKELLKQATWAVLASLAAIMLYVAFRFGEFSYGLGALVSLVHDVLMTVGWFCLTGRTFSMPVVAAILTLIGYSINDTIVVFDRIRENKKLTGGKITYFDLINRSVNETLARTILTAGTVFLCAVALYGFGGRVLNDFAFCFMVGVLTGTYSSIYIASPCVLWYHRGEGAKAKPASLKKAEPAKA